MQRWRKLPDFARTLAREVDPTIRATLEAALSACKRDGSPDHAIRVQAARALMQLGETPTPDDPNPTVITNVVQEPRELLDAESILAVGEPANAGKS